MLSLSPPLYHTSISSSEGPSSPSSLQEFLIATELGLVAGIGVEGPGRDDEGSTREKSVGFGGISNSLSESAASLKQRVAFGWRGVKRE